MGCDAVVALGRASVGGHTLFGQNSSADAGASQALCLHAGQVFPVGEKVATDFLEIPQTRQTHAVLGNRPAGRWGFIHGVNEFGLAVGCASYPPKLRGKLRALTGTDLVRLLLERCRNSRHAVETLGDLLERHGQGAFAAGPDGLADHAFLIADAAEAYAVETASRFWVSQQIHEVRAVSNLCTIRQDWDRISPGLGTLAIDSGWWPGDGSKVDFAEALAANPIGEASALRRWGRATLLLEQQNGHVDVEFLRRVLGDHYEGTHFELEPLGTLKGPSPLCQHGNAPGAVPTVASLVAELEPNPKRLRLAGCAFGPPCLSLYFPIFLEGTLPAPFCRLGPDVTLDTMNGRISRLNERMLVNPERLSLLRERMSQFQEEIDREAIEVAEEGAAFKQRGERLALESVTTSFMQRNQEQFDVILGEFDVTVPGRGPRRIEAGWTPVR